MQIRLDPLTDPAVFALLGEHLSQMHELSPPQSVHALDVSGLRGPQISFWTAWDGAVLLGCGALAEWAPGQGEVKSMRTASAMRRRGTGRSMLTHIVSVARGRGYEALSLETGTDPAFAPAWRLYESFGFEPCGPFGAYQEDPFSRFMRLRL